MLDILTEDARKAQRKKHTKYTFCVNCYSCIRPCGRTSVEEYRAWLKENGYDDIWSNVDSVEYTDRDESVQRDKTTSDRTKEDISKK